MFRPLNKNPSRDTVHLHYGLGSSAGQYFVISMGIWAAIFYEGLFNIHFSSIKAKNNSIVTANNSPCYKCHAVPTILFCFGKVAPTIIIS
jgi:hypothetical protein